ncbi:UNVERIFIED_CONTAM: hypothetical protein PYX00_000203 [Menopon gallinae]|uniref:Tetratricopeptide repeat protein 39C n=1 Tax=Menopon gallinae TaxID=328185 RepID=A0AAW2I7M3_9NEOP
MTDDNEDWRLAREGIKLLLNNKFEEAEELFTEKKDNIQMGAGYCFLTFMNALMTFEEDKLEESLQTLHDIEKRCVQDVGWLKSVKNKVFGSYSMSDPDLANKLEEQIILADSQVCIALLTFLQQDLTSYVKGGWVLRKAWKVYQHTYSQILTLYKKAYGDDAVIPGSQFPSWQVVTRSCSNSSLLSPSRSSEWSVPSTPSTNSNAFRNPLSYLASFAFSSSSQEVTIKPEVVARLMSAVSFGYGIFQLCLSLLPPSLLKLIHFLGFEGDRKIGISALMFSRQGNDMRGPLASLALLWYHTIIRPSFALDGANVKAGVNVAEQLINENEEEFGESALFLFFRGRVERLKSNIPKALEAYEAAIVKSCQREIRLLALHEVGWCYLILLDWGNAFHCFNQLRNRSKWSKSFYTYLTAVCVGACGDVDYAIRLAAEIPSLTNNEGNQIETFINRRVKKLPLPKTPSTGGEDQGTTQEPSPPQTCTDQLFFELLVFELLYLWNALPSCSEEHLNRMIEHCRACENEPMVGLSELIQGSVYLCFSSFDEAVTCFRAGLDKRSKCSSSEPESEGAVNDDHICVFSMFELAMILIQRPEAAEEGKSLLLQAQNNYKGYDFENRLTIRIHSALRKLG